MKMFSKALCALGGIAVLSTAAGFEFEYGEVTGSLKTKITIGATVRTEANDTAYIGILNVDGQQALCDTGQPIDFVGLDALGAPDPLGACALAGFGTFVNAEGSFTGHGTDDGKLNYDKNELVAAAAKAVSDFSASYKNFRFVSQIIAVTDPVNTDFDETHPNSFFTCAEAFDDDPDNDRDAVCGAQPRNTPREKDAEDTFNQIDLTTAYIEAETEFFDRTQIFRVGKQIIRWGESLALPINSINTINVPDPIRLHTPGFSLDELFDPTNAILFNTGVTDTVTFEAMYQLNWDPVRIDSPGTFYSPNDIAGIGNGRSAVTLGLGFSREDPSNLLDRPQGADIDTTQFGRDCFFDREGNINPDNDNGTLNQGGHRGAMIESTDEQGRPGLRPDPGEGALDFSSGRQGCLARTITPDDSGQWGLRFNWFAEALNDSEIGFYYLNYHSRLPYLSTYSAQLPGDTLDLGALGDLVGDVADIPLNDITNVVNALKVVDTLRPVLEYPEDIDMFGISASTNIGDYSVAMEYSYRPNLPLQVFPADVLFYGQATAFRESRCNSIPSQLDQYRNGDYEEFSNASNCPAVSNAPGELIQGYERFPVGQGELVAISLAETNPFLASSWIRILDIGFTKVFGMPDVSELAFQGGHAETLPLPGRRELDDDGNGNFDGVRSDGGANGGDSGGTNDLLTVLILNPQQEDEKAFATSFSWGYRFINVLTYEQIFGGTLEATFAFFHDVNGTTPGPGTNFIEDRKTIVWANSFKKGSYALGASYTWQTGGGNRNYIRDTDTFGVSLGYTF